MQRTVLAAALLAGLYAATVTAQPALDTDQDKTLYALGQAVGANLAQFHLTAAELAVVAAGLDDSVLGRDSRVDMQTYGPRIQGLAHDRAAAGAAAEKEASQAFLEKMAKEPGAERTASGLIYIPIKEGTGKNPTASDMVRVNYTGTLRDGTVFDSSVERGEPASFRLAGVIPCWTEGLPKMKIGGKAKLVCPSDIAYGDNGSGPIPGGAALVFEVELLDIE
jgi:FKBP-type peptidyl-prolyl cis-trans isomerase FkpA